MPFFTTNDGVRLHYQASGSGKPVLLIHGLTASSLFFQKQIPALSGHFQVIAPDLRGHGLSEASTDHLTMRRLAEDLKQFIDHLKLSEISLVGWSMGVHVIFEYIRNYSCDKIEKILIIEMAPRLMKSEDWRLGLPGVFSRKQGDFGHEDNLYLLSVMLDDWQAYSKVVVQRILNKSLYNEKMEFNAKADFKGKEDLGWLYEEAKKNNASVIAAFWIAMAVQDYRPVLKNIPVPCLLVYGTESNYYPAENYDYMQKQIPDARVVAFEGCGHALHIQDPELFNRLALDFLLAGFSSCEGQHNTSEPKSNR
ncbi:MAG TPA: alpha/beta hydrolase [Smithellaceae bacterium]|jgi:pimeloyl-ACP methyl ester carboxylesterase|nr:alpha/beta hydrolase [Smithella sp.]HNZ10094.1 alpha/beta hydrolase [Smithellaceae bacterium]HOG81879.1 alpha/beta hydrolase [Smithellaceae bacterium]HRY35886.1 alpha/beta hydrolase [Smithellaceae bacterium]